jgi:hypothetical protein
MATSVPAHLHAVSPDSVTTGTTQQTGETQINENTFAGETVRQIETVVESFRTGKAKKSQSIFKIGQILAAESKGDDQLKSDSLERYTITLDGIEAHAAQSDKHGTEYTNTVLGK